MADGNHCLPRPYRRVIISVFTSVMKVLRHKKAGYLVKGHTARMDSSWTLNLGQVSPPQSVFFFIAVLSRWWALNHFIQTLVICIMSLFNMQTYQNQSRWLWPHFRSWLPVTIPFLPLNRDVGATMVLDPCLVNKGNRRFKGKQAGHASCCFSHFGLPWGIISCLCHSISSSSVRICEVEKCTSVHPFLDKMGAVIFVLYLGAFSLFLSHTQASTDCILGWNYSVDTLLFLTSRSISLWQWPELNLLYIETVKMLHQLVLQFYGIFPLSFHFLMQCNLCTFWPLPCIQQISLLAAPYNAWVCFLCDGY